MTTKQVFACVTLLLAASGLDAMVFSRKPAKPVYEITYNIRYDFIDCEAPGFCTIEFRNVKSANLWGF